MINKFIDKGAPINVELNDITPVLIARSRLDWINVLKLLIDRGANIKKKYKNGETLMHMAIRDAISYCKKDFIDSGFCDMAIQQIVLLKNSGADMDAKNIDGKTPLDMAKIEGNKRILQVIQ